MEYKSVELELTDMNKETRTAVIAHSVYDNIDRLRDISRKGMFNKSWSESKKDIGFFINHDPKQRPGKVIDVFEDEKKAYTKVKLGNHTLGNDTLIMMDEGIISDASFGFEAIQKNFINVKGQKVRELKEVKHVETSVVTDMPVNPQAGVVKVFKSMNPSEIKSFTDRLNQLEKFCRDTNASDDCILSILNQIVEIKSLLSKYDTDSTLEIEPDSSKNDKRLMAITNINQKFKLESWQKTLKIPSPS